MKIDRSFVSALSDSVESGALIRTLVQLGKQLGLKTLAEGIEQHDQFCQLQLEECDSGQGFMFARPLPADAVESFLADLPRPALAAPGTGIGAYDVARGRLVDRVDPLRSSNARVPPLRRPRMRANPNTPACTSPAVTSATNGRSRAAGQKRDVLLARKRSES